LCDALSPEFGVLDIVFRPDGLSTLAPLTKTISLSLRTSSYFLIDLDQCGQRAAAGNDCEHVRRQLVACTAAPKDKIDLFQQPLEINRLGIELVAAGRKRLLARAAIACAVSAMTGMCRVAASSLRRRVTSQPFNTGKSRSIRMISGNSALALA
jgi:hypothetical protein